MIIKQSFIVSEHLINQNYIYFSQELAKREIGSQLIDLLLLKEHSAIVTATFTAAQQLNFKDSLRKITEFNFTYTIELTDLPKLTHKQLLKDTHLLTFRDLFMIMWSKIINKIQSLFNFNKKIGENG